MHEWVDQRDFCLCVLQQDVQMSERKNWKVSQSWTLPLTNGCRILIWLQNNEVTLAAGRWRYERTVQASSLSPSFPISHCNGNSEPQRAPE